MGLDVYSGLLVGTEKESEYKKIPKSARKRFDEDDWQEGDPDLWVDTDDEFLAIGYEVSELHWEHEPKEVDISRIEELKKKCIEFGIKNPKLIHVIRVEQYAS
jgi:hypothetical protein